MTAVWLCFCISTTALQGSTFKLNWPKSDCDMSKQATLADFFSVRKRPADQHAAKRRKVGLLDGGDGHEEVI